MNLRGLLRDTTGLRMRVSVLLMAGVLVTGIGFEAVFVSITRVDLLRELHARADALANGLAVRCMTPLVLGDSHEIRREVLRLAAEPDLVGVAVHGADGRALALVFEDPELGRRPVNPATPPNPQGRDLHRPGTATLHEVLIPVIRQSAAPRSPEADASELFDLDPAASASSRPARETVGWVRIVMSTDRLERAVARSAHIGLALLVVILLLCSIAVSRLARVVVQPLREASDLAREIAAGRLERRLPVRRADELGTLAESMNTMASSLGQARARAESEAEALRTVATAVLAIATGARSARDPESVFAMVVEYVRRVTSCEGVALLTETAQGPAWVIGPLAPDGPWGGLWAAGRIEGGGVLDRIEAHASARFAPATETDALSRGLAADGFHSGLLVALALEDGPRAHLLLVSRDPEGFAPSVATVVVGLASHLSSALRAARLQASLRHAFDELERTREYLAKSESLRVAGEMASGVAHEFNNVLAAILGRAQLLRRHLADGSLTKDELTRALGVIEKVSQDGGETVRRLRQFARTEPDAITELVDLGSVAEDAVEFTRARWYRQAQNEGRDISVMVDSPEPVPVAGRAHELREVVTNVLLNAIDALPRGGSIRLEAGKLDGRARLVATDDGVGMDEETRRRIFDPFFTTKGQKGSGLGMTMAYGIVRAHGGDITIASAPGGGTRVEIWLPLARADRTVGPAPVDGTRPAEPARPVVHPAPEASPLRALVVDDEKPVRDLLREILETLGARVESCESASAALDSFAPGAFDLVLTDLGMPEMNGWQLAAAIRGRDPRVLLAFVTGWGDQISPEEAVRAGADAVVSKPFTIEALEELAGSAHRRRAA